MLKKCHLSAGCQIVYTMSVQLKKHWNFIQSLISSSGHQRFALFQTVTDEQLSVICVIVLNTLQGHLAVPPQNLQTLKRHSTFLRSLTLNDLSKVKKKTAVLCNHKVILLLLQAVQSVLQPFVKQ